MPVLRDTSAVYHFGVFQLDASRGELLKRGIRIKIEGKPFQLLLSLLERSGEIVTREELRQRLWPADTFVEFDYGLNGAMKKLRIALGDSADNPRFVETITGKGYRFIAPVQVVDRDGKERESLDQGPANTEPLKPEKRPRIWTLPRVIGGVAIIIFIALAVWVARAKIGTLFASSRANATASPQIHSLAVLPLENLSSDPAQEYFADAMTDELITDIGQISALRVISRTSVMQYKNAHKSLPQIAHELNVDAVVEGTVLKSGRHVRITAQLIQASLDKHLWAESYEGDLRDVLGLQNKVARAIADEIRVQLTPEQQVLLQPDRVANPEALENYLKGRYFLNRRDRNGLDKAVEFFQQAIADDPNYPVAYGGLADSYVVLASSVFGSRSSEEYFSQARTAANKAISLDPTVSDAHVVLAMLAAHEYNFAESERQFQLAVTYGPNNASAHHRYAVTVLAPEGRLQEAEREMNQARMLDPVSRVIATDCVGAMLFIEGRNDEAYRELSDVIQMDPGFSDAYMYRAAVLIQEKRFREALADLENAKRTDNTPYRLAILGWGFGVAGEPAKARAVLSQLKVFSKQTYVSPWSFAMVYLGLGDKDQTFAWLDKAYAEHALQLLYLKTFPVYAPLRSDPRFPRLLARIGLPQ